MTPRSSKRLGVQVELGGDTQTDHTVVDDDHLASSNPQADTQTFSSSLLSIPSDNAQKSSKVNPEDPCYKVLPAVLKRYKMNEDWRNYALFIVYDDQERCISYDEKPLLIYQELKETDKNPAFMLRHIKDLEPSMAAAYAEHAAECEMRLRKG